MAFILLIQEKLTILVQVHQFLYFVYIISKKLRALVPSSRVKSLGRQVATCPLRCPRQKYVQIYELNLVKRHSSEFQNVQKILLCMHVWSSHIGEYGSTGSGCQSCSWPAEQGKLIFPCPRACLRIWSRETGSAVPSRVSLLISILRVDLVLTGFLPSSAAASIYETAIRHRVSPAFIGSRNYVPMAFTAESPPAQGQ